METYRGIGPEARHGTSTRHLRKALHDQQTRQSAHISVRMISVMILTFRGSEKSNVELLHVIVYEVHFVVRHEPAIREGERVI